jgi:hypothetical protein
MTGRSVLCEDPASDFLDAISMHSMDVVSVIVADEPANNEWEG